MVTYEILNFYLIYLSDLCQSYETIKKKKKIEQNRFNRIQYGKPL